MAEQRLPTIEEVESQLCRFDEPPGRNLYETARRKESHLERLLGEVRRAGLFNGAPLNSKGLLLQDWLERQLARAKEDSQAALLNTVTGLTREEAEALKVEEKLHAAKWGRHEEEQGALLRELFDAAGCRVGEGGFHPYSGPLAALVAVHTGTGWEEIRDGAVRAHAQDQDEGSTTAEARRRLVACVKARALDILYPPSRRAYLKRVLYAYRHIHFQFSSDDPDTPGETVLLFPRLVEGVRALLEAEEARVLEQTPPVETAESDARASHDERLEEHERALDVALIGLDQVFSGRWDAYCMGDPQEMRTKTRKDVVTRQRLLLNHIDRWAQGLDDRLERSAYLEKMRSRYLRASATEHLEGGGPWTKLLEAVERLLEATKGSPGMGGAPTRGMKGPVADGIGPLSKYHDPAVLDHLSGWNRFGQFIWNWYVDCQEEGVNKTESANRISEKLREHELLAGPISAAGLDPTNFGDRRLRGVREAHERGELRTRTGLDTSGQ